MMTRLSLLVFLIAATRACAQQQREVAVSLLETWAGGGPSVAVTVASAGSYSVGDQALLSIFLRWFVGQTDSFVPFVLHSMQTPITSPAATCMPLPGVPPSSIINSTGFACALDECAASPPGAVPTLVTQASSVATVGWLEYVVHIVCMPTAVARGTLDVSVFYGLTYGGVPATSADPAPYVTMRLSYVPAAATVQQTVAFPMRATQAPDPADGFIEYGMPLSVAISLLETAAADMWYVEPLLVVAVARDAPPGFVAAVTGVEPGVPADDTWCGLNDTDVVAAASLLPASASTLELLPGSLGAHVGELPPAFDPASGFSVNWDAAGTLYVNLTNGLVGSSGATVQLCVVVQTTPQRALAVGGARRARARTRARAREKKVAPRARRVLSSVHTSAQSCAEGCRERHDVLPRR